MESTSTNVTIRMDKETKRDFETFCDNVGINLTTAFNMFVKATLRTRELPFIVSDINTQKKETLKRFNKTIADMQEQSVINGTDNMTMDKKSRDAMFGYLRGQYTMAEDFDAPLEDFREYMK